MSPGYSTHLHHQPPPTVDGINPDESDSDDGEDLEEGDMYLPRNLTYDHVIDDGYDKDHMEMDGQYIEDIAFNFAELEEELVPPPNMYYGNGLCL